MKLVSAISLIAVIRRIDTLDYVKRGRHTSAGEFAKDCASYFNTLEALKHAQIVTIPEEGEKSYQQLLDENARLMSRLNDRRPDHKIAKCEWCGEMFCVHCSDADETEKFCAAKHEEEFEQDQEPEEVPTIVPYGDRKVPLTGVAMLIFFILGFFGSAKAQTPLLNNQHPTVWLGDSITRSYRLPYWFGTDKAYFNLGISGKTCSGMADDWDFVFSSIYPRNIVIWCGINDLTKSYDISVAEDHLKALITMANSSGMGIVVVSLFPTAPSYPYLAKFQAFNAWSKAYVASLNNPNIVYIDLVPVFAGPDGYIADSTMLRDGYIHPSLKAYQIITPMISVALSQVRK